MRSKVGDVTQRPDSVATQDVGDKIGQGLPSGVKEILRNE